MNNNYLDKVVGQIVSETIVDHDKEEVSVPFPRFSTPLSSSPCYFFPFTSLIFISFPPVSPHPSFVKHCRDVYGLNEQEIKYVWKEYRNIIKDEIDGK